MGLALPHPLLQDLEQKSESYHNYAINYKQGVYLDWVRGVCALPPINGKKCAKPSS